MKRVLPIAVAFTLIINQVGATCFAGKARGLCDEPTPVRVSVNENLSESDKMMQQVVDQVLAELKKREAAKSNGEKNTTQSKSSLPVRVLKTLFKPIYWVSKAGAFIVKQLFWLVHGSWLAIIASVGTTIAIFKTGGAGIKEAEGPIKNIIDEVGIVTNNILDNPNTLEVLNQINALQLHEIFKEATKLPWQRINDTAIGALEELQKLMAYLNENPQLAKEILSQMFNLLGNLQPEELARILTRLMATFHPDNLSNLRKMSKKDVEKVYFLLADAKEKLHQSN